MAFSDSVKLEAKQRSNFACAACGLPFVEVHHIIPQEENGPDTIDNACPLCARCHDLVGGNREKRKQLREMRDHQWKGNELKRQIPDISSINQKLDGFMQHLQASDQTHQGTLSELKSLLVERNSLANAAILKADTFKGVIAASGTAAPEIIKWGPVGPAA